MTDLHPQNDRVGDEGIDDAIGEFLNYRRRPYRVIAEDDDRKHRTPLCPEVQGPWRLMCDESALYLYGERWCDTCRMHDLDSDDSGWTDPRYDREVPA